MNSPQIKHGVFSMAIKEHYKSNSTDNRVPSEISHMVSSSFEWYELQIYSSDDLNGIDIRLFEKINGHWFEVNSFSYSSQAKIVLKKNPDTGGGGGFFKGIVKKTASDIWKEQADILAKASGMKYYSKADGTEKTLAKDGNDPFPLNGAAEQAGGQMAVDSGITSAAKVAVAAISVKGALRNPSKTYENIKDTIKKATTDTRSPTEALGKAGMEQAKNRQGLKTDERFKDRYHGPDDLAKDKNGKLTEIEAKGNNKNSKAVAKDKKGRKQGSRKKNKTRAKTMAKKSDKVDVPSNRQGGIYTQDEIELWQNVLERNGNKRHVSTHTNTETGQVKVYERDSDGNITKTLDDFKLDNFDNVKEGINNHFSN